MITYTFFIDHIIPLLGFIVSIVACLYTIKTYKKSHSILDVIQQERIWKWNKKELEYLFSYIPIGSIESFFRTPNIIRNELWCGLQKMDLNSFQFDGKGKDLIIQFINGLDSFCDLHYTQTPSKHWKFEPFSSQEPYDEEKERQEIKKLHTKALELMPLYLKIKDLLSSYQIDMREMNKKSLYIYNNSST